jgi:hypothetical protein
MRFLKIMVAFSAVVVLTGCDPDGKENCDWTLEPETTLIGTTTEPGMIPVCARNRVTNKQDCRFQTTMDFAKSAWNRKFKFVDIKADMRKLPRIITDIKFCSAK